MALLRLFSALLAIWASALSCSGDVDDTVYRGVYVAYAERPALGVGRLAAFDRTKEDSKLAFTYPYSEASNPPRWVGEIPLSEPVAAGWFYESSPDFFTISATGRIGDVDTVSNAFLGAIDAIPQLANVVAGQVWNKIRFVVLAQKQPPQILLFITNDIKPAPTLDLPGEPAQLTVDQSRDRACVSIPEKDVVLVLGLDPLRTLVSLSFPKGSGPTALAVGESGRIYIGRTGDGVITVVQTDLTSQSDYSVGGAPASLAIGRGKEDEGRLVVANPSSRSFQFLKAPELELVNEAALGGGGTPVAVIPSPDPHFALFISRGPHELGGIDLRRERIDVAMGLPDAPAALFIQPPLPPDKSRF